MSSRLSAMTKERGASLAQTERDAEIGRRIAAEAELVRLQEQLRRMQQD